MGPGQEVQNFYTNSAVTSAYQLWVGSLTAVVPCDAPHPAISLQIAIAAMIQVKTIVTRTNTISGHAYAQDPTIFAWEARHAVYCTALYLLQDCLADYSRQAAQTHSDV